MELGSILVDLTETAQADPLFDRLPPVLDVYSIHKDIVVNLPPHEELRILGGTDNTSLQALAIGKMIRAVQFHPELSENALAMLMKVRGLRATLRAKNHGPQILHNWYRHWIQATTT